MFEFLIFIIFKESFKLNFSVSLAVLRPDGGYCDELCNVLVVITRVWEAARTFLPDWMDLRTALQLLPKREVIVPNRNGTTVAHVTALPVTVPISHENQTGQLAYRSI